VQGIKKQEWWDEEDIIDVKKLRNLKGTTRP
jgi:hypothetical protein